MLDDWRGMDVDRACNYIYKCQVGASTMYGHSCSLIMYSGDACAVSVMVVIPVSFMWNQCFFC